MDGEPVGPGAVQLTAIAGSLRRDSANRKLLHAAAALVPTGVELTIWEGLKAVPPFDEDDERRPVPAAVAALRRAITAADAVLLACPEYNGSLPGQLKNALDWASRPLGASVLTGTPVAVVGASPSRSGAARAHAEARTVLARAGARVLDVELALARAYEAFDSDGRLREPGARERLSALLSTVAGTACQPTAA